MKYFAVCLMMVVVSLLTSGCKSEDVYIQDSTEFSPLQQHPIHTLRHDNAGDISVSGGIHIFPKTLLDGRVDGHSPVSTNGRLVVDTVAGSNPP